MQRFPSLSPALVSPHSARAVGPLGQQGLRSSRVPFLSRLHLGSSPCREDRPLQSPCLVHSALRERFPDVLGASLALPSIPYMAQGGWQPWCHPRPPGGISVTPSWFSVLAALTHFCCVSGNWDKEKGGKSWLLFETTKRVEKL